MGLFNWLKKDPEIKKQNLYLQQQENDSYRAGGR